MLDYQFPIDDIHAIDSYEFAKIETAFDYISNESQLIFEFPQGGCQQRSHMISLILSKKFRIENFKIWLFAPASLYEYDFRTLFVEDPNKLSFENIVNWNYHTAPIVKINKGKETIYYVIDPSIDRQKPLSLDHWLHNIGNSQISKYTFLYPDKYFFNCKYNDYSQLTNVFDGSFFEYTNPAKDNLVLEKGLAVNDMAMKIYAKYILPLVGLEDHKSLIQLQDLKDIFGNATALDLLFAQNLSGNTDNTSYRYVLGNYSKIMKEAKQIFHERLIYWTKKTNELLENDATDSSLLLLHPSID